MVNTALVHLYYINDDDYGFLLYTCLLTLHVLHALHIWDLIYVIIIIHMRVHVYDESTILNYKMI